MSDERPVLDLGTAQYLEVINAAESAPDVTIEEMRQHYVLESAEREKTGSLNPPGIPVTTEDVEVNGLWCRIYRPKDQPANDRPLPVVLYFHGGGWVIGDRNTHDLAARAFTALPAIVVSAEYRLAPEDPYPAGLDDAWSWTQWTAENLEFLGADGRIIVAGDSSGAALALWAALRARDEELDLAAHCLLYPPTNPALDAASVKQFAEGYSMTEASLRWFQHQFRPAGMVVETPWSAYEPITAELLRGLPRTVVAVAEADPLADDGVQLIDELRRGGVETAALVFPGLIHGFANHSTFSIGANTAMTSIVAAVAGMLNA